MFPTTKNEIIRYCIEKEEGGWQFTDHKDDAGGATYAGVTYNTYAGAYADQFGGSVTEEQFKSDALNNEPVLRGNILAIYSERYYEPLCLDDLPDYLRCMLFSMAVNIGTQRAAKILQEVINQETVKGGHAIEVDGNIGPITVQSANNFLVYNLELIRLRVKHRLFYKWQSYYNTLVINNAIAWRDAALNNTFRPQTLRAVNLQGWFNRAVKYIEPE